MKIVFTLLINLGAFLFSFSVCAQAPDLSGIHDDKEKVKVWLDWCNSLQVNQKGLTDNFVLLKQDALKGLQLAGAKDPQIRAQFFFYAALGYYYQVQFDSAQYYFYQSLYSGQKAGSAELVSRACVVLIPVNFQLQQQSKVDECKNILQTIVDTTKDRSLLQDGYYALGSYYQQKSYYSTAQDYFIKSLESREREVDTTKEVKKKFDYAIQCDMLSKLYLNTQMMDKSLQALQQGQRFAGVSPNVSNRLFSSFVEAFTQSGNIDSALYYNDQLEAATKGSDGFPSERFSSNLNIAIYYIDHKAYVKAVPYLDKGESIALSTKAPMLIFQAQMIRGRYLEETGKYETAIPVLMQSLPVAKQFSRELYSNVLLYLALAQKGKGNVNTALQYYEEHAEQSDSLTKEKLANSFADQETRYETSRKEQQIVSLGKENRLKALELENAGHTRMLLIVGLVALGIIALLLYFFYRNKENLNRQLAQANDTKARLFGIISHDLRSPVSRIVQLLQIQKENPALLDEATRRRHEDKLRSASEDVLETMEDLLLWSKSQMQHFTPQLHPVQLDEVLDKEINLQREGLEQKGLRIDKELPAGFSLIADENFLAVILRNLLQNAVKYSENNSSICITANGHTVSVTNRSARTDADELNARLNNGKIDSRNSGMGLQIARDLAVSIGAKISFRSGGEEHSIRAVLSWQE